MDYNMFLKDLTIIDKQLLHQYSIYS